MKWTNEQKKELKEKHLYYFNNRDEAEEYFKRKWSNIRSKASQLKIVFPKIRIRRKKFRTEKDNEIERIKLKSLSEFCNYEDIIMIRDTELLNVLKHIDSTSRYIIKQYLKNKNIIVDNDSVLKISTDTKGYYKLKDEIIKLRRCYRCDCYVEIKDAKDGYHHIIPIKNGGDDSEYNIMFLCKKCHDYVEDETSKLYIKGKNLSVEKLKTYIRTDFPM